MYRDRTEVWETQDVYYQKCHKCKNKIKEKSYVIIKGKVLHTNCFVENITHEVP